MCVAVCYVIAQRSRRAHTSTVESRFYYTEIQGDHKVSMHLTIVL
jgi:hypothetical protein